MLLYVQENIRINQSCFQMFSEELVKEMTIIDNDDS